MNGPQVNGSSIPGFENPLSLDKSLLASKTGDSQLASKTEDSQLASKTEDRVLVVDAESYRSKWVVSFLCLSCIRKLYSLVMTHTLICYSACFTIKLEC